MRLQTGPPRPGPPGCLPLAYLRRGAAGEPAALADPGGRGGVAGADEDRGADLHGVAVLHGLGALAGCGEGGEGVPLLGVLLGVRGLRPGALGGCRGTLSRLTPGCRWLVPLYQLLGSCVKLQTNQATQGGQTRAP